MSHNHSLDDKTNTSKLIVAVFINIILTIVQIVAGLFSGSLSLLADALHNLSDAGAIVVAIVARVIGNKPANKKMPYGYKRAEMIGVLVNSTTLIVVGIYLIVESFDKYLNPTPVNGWIVFSVATFALIVDLVTAYITYSSGAKENMNIRAAFIHNVSDALASVVVIVAGGMIVLYEMYIVDVIATLLISIYVIYHGVLLLTDSTRIIMQATPKNIDVNDVIRTIYEQSNVDLVKSVRIWQLNEHDSYLDAKVVISNLDFDLVLYEIKQALHFKYGIENSVIEVTNKVDKDAL
ncbi:cation diffusion facilitator family transporter [Photobacterium damselae]|uniref:cation diffusion facilitator family transporter n=1 Tax=Photobacterium damselae TaxID=38293 RepID=UPI0030F3A4D1